MGRSLTVSPAPLDLHALVAGIVDELRMAFAQRLIVHVAQGVRECFADADRGAQLLGNLVSNAMAYGEGAGVVTIVSAVEGQRANLSVHNRGTPIPEELQGSLFEPMVRGDPPGAGGPRSVGLGLFIVRAIAQAHAGGLLPVWLTPT